MEGKYKIWERCAENNSIYVNGYPYTYPIYIDIVQNQLKMSPGPPSCTRINDTNYFYCDPYGWVHVSDTPSQKYPDANIVLSSWILGENIPLDTSFNDIHNYSPGYYPLFKCA